MDGLALRFDLVVFDDPTFAQNIFHGCVSVVVRSCFRWVIAKKCHVASVFLVNANCEHFDGFRHTTTLSRKRLFCVENARKVAM